MRRSLVPLALGASLVLAGCAETPMGPTVSMLPSPGKDFALFQGEQQQCESYAAAAVKGQG